jgi:hypothetical protein
MPNFIVNLLIGRVVLPDLKIALPFQSQLRSCGNAGGGSVWMICDSSCENGYHITLHDAASAMRRVLSFSVVVRWLIDATE